MSVGRYDIADQVRLSADDLALVARRRHDHTRLGLAYQVAFVRLTGRLPRQRPFEAEPDLLRLVADQLDVGGAEPEALAARYAARRPTVSEHADVARRHLGVRPFGDAERAALRVHLRVEAAHLERPAGLVAAAEAYLRRERVLLPATSALRRLVGEVRAEVAEEIDERVGAALSDGVRVALDGLLDVDDDRLTSPLQSIKEPPGHASPRALVAETEKLETIRATGALGVDLSWLRPSLRKALAHRVRYSSAYRLRELGPARRYAALVCFLHEAHADTVDHVVDLQAKLVTQALRTGRAVDRPMHRSKRRRRSHKSTAPSAPATSCPRRRPGGERVGPHERSTSPDLLGRRHRARPRTPSWSGSARPTSGSTGEGDPFAVVAGPAPVTSGGTRRRSWPHLDFEADPAGGSAQAEDLVESARRAPRDERGREAAGAGRRAHLVHPEGPLRYVQSNGAEGPDRPGGVRGGRDDGAPRRGPARERGREGEQTVREPLGALHAGGGLGGRARRRSSAGPGSRRVAPGRPAPRRRAPAGVRGIRRGAPSNAYVTVGDGAGGGSARTRRWSGRARRRGRAGRARAVARRRDAARPPARPAHRGRQRARLHAAPRTAPRRPACERSTGRRVRGGRGRHRLRVQPRPADDGRRSPTA